MILYHVLAFPNLIMCYCICHKLYAMCYSQYAICHLLFCMGSSICPVEIWSSLRCGGFLWGIMLSASSHLPYAICHLLFCMGFSNCPIEIWSSLSLRRLPHGHHVLRFIPFAIRYKPFAVLCRLQHMPHRNLVLAALRRISLGHHALRQVPLTNP